ncbi:MAG: SUMF1/EgtB/PvdO family nonheme iron enzyme [Blastocatellia bacterium]
MIGRTIGNYEIINRFGEGGMGELYLGRHTRLAREVIVKTIRTDEFSPKQLEHLRVRLEREAFIQSQLDNSHIVRVYDFIAIEDTTCMVMEYVKGRDLRKMIIEETGPIQSDRAIKLFRQVLEAIEYAHNFTYTDQAGHKYQGIIHRDLKPANILVTPEDLVKVTDFGIVKVRGATGGTQLGFNPGTPEYMSPEQARGREIDQRSDIYSLGIVLFEMLTGRVPFEDDMNATSDYEVRRGHIEMPVPRPSELYPGIPPALEAVVLQALEKDPDDRYQTARDFLNAVVALENPGKSVAAPVSAPADRRTVLQPGRDMRPGTAPVTPAQRPAQTEAKTGQATAVAAPPLRAMQQTSAAGTEVSLIEAPQKSKMPLLAGIAAVLILGGAFAAWKMMPGGEAVTTNNTGGGGTAMPKTEAGMVMIAGGDFMMGRDTGDPNNQYEKPAHPVTVKPFYIDKTEVTNEQYASFITQTRRQPPSYWANGTFPPGEATYPVVNISWNDAKAYAEFVGKRLPNEDEWEFAARGTENRIYPYGNEWKPQYSNASEDGFRKARAVGSYPDGSSPFGVMDMAGNVAEWTASDYAPYPNSKAKPQEGQKVVRGGAYNTPAKEQTATDRFFYPPSRAESFIGFRCAKDAN